MTQELPEGTVTVLFTDVVGSTELTTRLGDDAAREVLGGCDELVRQQVERHRGHEVKGTGDGLMVAFTSARRAVACAIDMQRAIVEQGRRDAARAIGVRIGLNTGEVVREEEDLFGATVNAAARIAAEGDAGDILVSEGVKIVLGAGTTVELEDRGESQLKGFNEPWRLYSVRWREPAGAGALGTPGRTPYVGRDEERAELRRRLNETLAGRGSLVMIGGEPGVGKTRIAEELMAEAADRGMLALVGHCYEVEGGLPYIPFVEILESAAQLVTAEGFRAALGDSAPEVAKIMPSLRRLFPDIAMPLELPAEQERHFLFNSVREFVTRAASVQPILLVLDDLHWADDSTLLLVQHLAQPLSQLRVLIVGTYRDVELDVGRPLAKTLEDLLRQRLAHRISLRRLPEAGVEAMLHAVSGQRPPASLVQAIYRETEGNPFFVEEVFQHLAEEGKLFDSGGRWLPDLQMSELDVPEGVRLVIGRRLQRVGEECRSALTGAAVIGRVFTFELLEAMGELDPDALLDAIDQAERAQLIVAPSESREARFTFAHELIRQTLLSGLSLPRRQRVHLRVAEAMERVYARALEEHAVDVAHHLYEAGAAADTGKTVRYLALAAEQALASAAFEDALRHCESALSLDIGDALARADILFKRGQARRSLGRWDDALADWREALPAYEKAGDAETMGRVAWEIVYQLLWSAQFAEGLEISQRALAVLGDKVSADRCRLLSASGLALGLAGARTAAEAPLAEAMAMAEELNDPHLLGEILYFKTTFHWSFQEIEQGLATARKAEELLRAAGDLWTLAGLLWMPEFFLNISCRFDEAAAIASELQPLARRLGHEGALMSCERDEAFRLMMQTADLERYDAFWERDLVRCQRIGAPWISNTYNNMGQSLFWQGRWHEALEQFREAVRLEPPGMLAGFDWIGLLLATAYLGDKAGALALLDERKDSIARAGQPNTLGAWCMALGAVEALALLGEAGRAANMYPLILESIETGALTRGADSRLQQSVAGIAAAAGQQWDKAEEHYETALRQAHELPILTEQPEVRRWYARMLIDRDAPGDRERARELLDEAIIMYRKIGMPKHVELADGMLREL